MNDDLVPQLTEALHAAHDWLMRGAPQAEKPIVKRTLEAALAEVEATELMGNLKQYEGAWNDWAETMRMASAS